MAGICYLLRTIKLHITLLLRTVSFLWDRHKNRRFLCKFVKSEAMRGSIISIILLFMTTGLSAQTFAVDCANNTGAEIGVTVVLKTPAGKSLSFRCDRFETKSFECDLKETGEYSLIVIFREGGGRKPVIPFGTCKFTVTGAEISVKAETTCGLMNMVIPCESQFNFGTCEDSDSSEYSNRCHGILTVRKFYPVSVGTEMTVFDNITERTSAWDISVTSLPAEG